MGEVSLRFLQGGLETTKGTKINATRILMARVASVAFNQPREFVEEDRGTLVDAQRFIGGAKDYGLTIEQAGATYEELGWFFQTAVNGSVTAATINSTGKRYIFTPQTSAGGDTLQAASFEFGDDTQSFMTTYGEVDQFTLGFASPTAGQATPVTLSLQYFVSSFASNTKTASLSLPTVETILATAATFYIGATTTGFGSLALTSNSLRSFSLTYNNQLGRKIFPDSNSTYTVIGRGRRIVTFEGEVEGDIQGVPRFTEWDLGTYKRMRIQFAGTTISGSSPSTTRKLIIDGQVQFTSFDPVQSIDTNTVYRIAGRYMPDAALSNAEIQFTLDNDVASYS